MFLILCKAFLGAKQTRREYVLEHSFILFQLVPKLTTSFSAFLVCHNIESMRKRLKGIFYF